MEKLKQSKLIGQPIFTSESGSESVTLTEVKNHLYIDTGNTDFDTRLTALIKECREYIEQITALSLISRTITIIIDYESSFTIPFGPVTSFTSAAVKSNVSTYDVQVLNDDYEIEAGRFISYNGNWRFKMIYVGGYTASTIPHGLKLGLLNEIARRFEHRGDAQIMDTNELVQKYINLEWTI